MTQLVCRTTKTGWQIGWILNHQSAKWGAIQKSSGNWLERYTWRSLYNVHLWNLHVCKFGGSACPSTETSGLSQVLTRFFNPSYPPHINVWRSCMSWPPSTFSSTMFCAALQGTGRVSPGGGHSHRSMLHTEQQRPSHCQGHYAAHRPSPRPCIC